MKFLTALIFLVGAMMVAPSNVQAQATQQDAQNALFVAYDACEHTSDLVLNNGIIEDIYDRKWRLSQLELEDGTLFIDLYPTEWSELDNEFEDLDGWLLGAEGNVDTMWDTYWWAELAYDMGDYDDCISLCLTILDLADITEDLMETIETNVANLIEPKLVWLENEAESLGLMGAEDDDSYDDGYGQ